MTEIDTTPPGDARSAGARSAVGGRSGSTPADRRPPSPQHPSVRGASGASGASGEPPRPALRLVPATVADTDAAGSGGHAVEATGDATARDGADAALDARPVAPLDQTVTVPLNEAAAVYEALADQIRGSAVGWSDHALAQLERGLLDRYGPLIGGRHPVRRLVRLAARPPAA